MKANKDTHKNFSRRNRTATRFRRLVAITGAFALAVALMMTPLVNVITQVSAMGSSDSVIIQLKDDPAAVWKAKQQKAGNMVSADQLQNYRSSLKNAQDLFLAALSSNGISYQLEGVDVPNFDGTNAGHVDFRYSLVLNGLNLKVPSAAIQRIRAMPQVKSVQPNGSMVLQLEKSVDYIRAPLVYGQFQELTPFDTFNEGYEGQGMKVAVIDTGIDWTNPMFGGDPTPPRLGLAPPTAAVNYNQKIIYYLTFTGGLVDDFGHGTHSSADIAGYLATAPGADKLPGTLDDVKLHGVAPQARLMGYKVCTGAGTCLSSSIIMALEDAVSPTSPNLQPKPIANVINMSLGGSGGPDDATSVASDNAALTGTIVVASAGNSGPGEGTVGSPAAGRHVIAVGANYDPAAGSNTADLLASGGRTGMIANLMDGAAAVTSDITSNYVYCGLAETPADCPSSVSGKIALIARGSTFTAPAGGVGTGLFSNKATSAAADGAVAAIIYNNTDGELSAATVRASTIPVVGLSKANGEYLKSLIGADPTGVSANQIRINKALLFAPQMADFSSRGPVQGLGQIKPDVTAPGVNIYSATARVGSAETSTATMFDPTGFIHASGTSFSGPHVSGAATLVKQAHLNWSPDMVRTALINTATNLRSSSGTPLPNGNQADSIMSQGGGLIDVYAAVNTKSLMGVQGDGITAPGILGSYSFGEAPIINNRIVNTRQVTGVIEDVSGQGGVYDLSTVNNRFFDTPGISASVSPSTVTVPPGGSASFTATVSLDGNQVRDTSSSMELQWYVVAHRETSSETLHMPMYFRADPTLPSPSAGGTSKTDTFTGTVLAGDAGAQQTAGVFVANGATYNDIPFTPDPAAVSVKAHLAFTDIAGMDFGLSDLDLYLLGPDGNVVTSSTVSGGPEDLSAPVMMPGTYTYRVYGFLAADTPYTLTSTQTLGSSSPTANPITANFVDNTTGNRYDFDGNYNVTWLASGTVDSFELEESTDGTHWNVIQSVAGNVTSATISNAAEGTHSYRVRAIGPGQIGEYVTNPSNVQNIIVSYRALVDATSSIDIVNKSITFPAGSTQIVSDLKNNTSTMTFYPNVTFEITSISSTGNTVKVTNADNGGDGVTTEADYDYSQLVGGTLGPGQESGSRTLQFTNPNNVLFTFTARVMANVATGTGGGTGGSTSGGTSGTTGSTGSGTGGTGTTGTTKLLKFTVNPLTKGVTVQLL